MRASKMRFLSCLSALALAAALAVAAPLARPAAAQEAATLVADRVQITGDNRLIAEGSVEIFYRGRKLTAQRITYDKTGERLRIEGPIVLTEPGSDGVAGSVLIADEADLAPDLRDGVLVSARMVLAEQLQLAARRITRAEGRYTEMSRVVASSCEVCPSNPVPLWEIRAARVLHDADRKQLYFTDAQLRVGGVPIVQIPRLRLPDPTQTRASGFLIPVLVSNSLIGTGLRLPYFMTLGDSRDVLLSPFVTTEGSRTLGLRYRQAFRTGTLQFDGAITRDRIQPGDTRYYLFGTGKFDLPRGFTLSATLRAASDRDYLSEYDISDADRLRSGVTIERTRADEYIAGRVLEYRSLRAGEDNALLPTTIIDTTLRRRYGVLGGTAGLRFDTHGHHRISDEAFDTNLDGLADGRDMARATLGADWRRSWLLGAGVVGTAIFDVTGDVYAISDDATYAGSVARVTPGAAIELRWPWMRPANRPNGSVQIIEPVVQLVWSPDTTSDIPNEESQLAEFDEGNLFSFSRFPGQDVTERGLRANVGLGWQRHAATGWTLGLMAGRVFRVDEDLNFSTGTGLAGQSSDWLLAAHLSTVAGWTVSNRLLISKDFEVSRNELRFGWAGDRATIGGSYLWLEPDPAVGRPSESHELILDAAWKMGLGWEGKLATHYDIVAERAPRLALGLTYRNECVTTDLSLSRRFASSTSVTPTTSFGLSVSLSGFGAGGEGSRRVCRR